MALKDLKEKLKSRKSYLKKGKQWLAERFDCTVEEVEEVLSELQQDTKAYRDSTPSGSKIRRQVVTYLNKIRERNPGEEFIYTEQPEIVRKKRGPYKKGDPDNVLFIGDLHAPFILDGYLDFNIDLQKKYNAGTIIFAGDVIDSHSWSYHEKDVDGMSVKDELCAAIKQLEAWYNAFPDATILYGNHDLLISRKARTFGLSQLFLRKLGDIIEAPKSWKFVHELYRDKVYYTHGSVGNAFKRAIAMRHSVAQGHLHSEAGVNFSVSEVDKVFGLQVGCGIDRNAYAFEYGKQFAKKPVISSGVILEKGRLPLLELMDL